MTLNELRKGEKAKVLAMHVDSNLELRLLHFGLLVGAVVSCEFESPFHDPKAYLVGGTMFALRNCDASKIEVQYE